MPAAKKPSRSKRSTAKKPAEPAAVKRLNKSLDAAQDALGAMRKDVDTGARDFYRIVEKAVKEARRDGRKLGRALQRDIEKARKANASKPKRAGTARRKPAAKKKPAARAKK
jgi:hypothetical protein